MSDARRCVREARRIVVKVGSSVLTDAGAMESRVFGSLARQISRLADEGREVVLVSSGAVAMGSHLLAWERTHEIPRMQAAAAVGQIGVIETYRRRFARYGRRVAQILVTQGGLQSRERYLNARNTMNILLREGVVPIVNENDTVATDEIRFGDNDNLSATVVNLVGADLLVILSDVEGLYAARPEPGAPLPERFDVVEAITPAIRRAASGEGSAFGRGGMVTKLQAADTAARSGAATVICHGKRRNALIDLLAGRPIGTLFLAGHRLRSRKHWLAFSTRPRGEIRVDAGAARALGERGSSLLPAGIVSVAGKFGIGDVVACVDPEGHEIARGLTAYGSADIARMLGLPTGKIAEVLGYSNGGAVVHRSNLVLVPHGGTPPEGGDPSIGAGGRSGAATRQSVAPGAIDDEPSDDTETRA